MDKELRISIENLDKIFNIGFKKHQSILARFISLISGKEPKRKLHALKNINLKIKKGELIGLIGNNGSGKSTLLRCISGIYINYSGNIRTNGKIISIINLGNALQSRLSMKDNIYLCGSLFGLGIPEISKKYNSIINFAELEKYENTKIYQFSNGMLQRLAFSVAIHCNPDILLLDEVFEVGDQSFRKKSAKKIQELVKYGATVILVSHEIDLIEKYCDNIIWMEKGEVKKIGKVREIIKNYKLNN